MARLRANASAVLVASHGQAFVNAIGITREIAPRPVAAKDKGPAPGKPPVRYLLFAVRF
jgi:hypothetical protein